MGRFAPGVWQPDDDPAELYYLPDDFSQADNLAELHPEKVKELQELFWAEGRRNQGASAAGPAEFLFRPDAAASRADHLHLLR